MKKRLTKFYEKVLIKNITLYYLFLLCGLLLFLALCWNIRIDGKRLLFYILNG